MIRFEVNHTGNAKVMRAFDGLYSALSRDSQRGILIRAANIYVSETKKRFEKQYDVDRKKWKENTDTTIRLKTTGWKGRGPAVNGPTHVGVWTGDLVNSIRYRLLGDEVLIGSDLPYATTFHYGAKKGTLAGARSRLGASRKRIAKGKEPLSYGGSPWGDIKPRRFLGRNNRTDSQVVLMIRDELAKKIGLQSVDLGRDYL
jgi:phage gpG-like protein